MFSHTYIIGIGRCRCQPDISYKTPGIRQDLSGTRQVQTEVTKMKNHSGW